jgi:hypothetical protein
MAQSSSKVTKAISAQNTFSDILRVAGKKVVNLSITSTALNATVVVQRKRPEDSVWGDIASFTANAEKIIESAGRWDYRAGVKTGGFTSATALVVTLSV